jgi:hypothetical protein
MALLTVNPGAAAKTGLASKTAQNNTAPARRRAPKDRQCFITFNLLPILYFALLAKVGWERFYLSQPTSIID